MKFFVTILFLALASLLMLVQPINAEMGGMDMGHGSGMAMNSGGMGASGAGMGMNSGSMGTGMNRAMSGDRKK